MEERRSNRAFYVAAIVMVLLLGWVQCYGDDTLTASYPYAVEVAGAGDVLSATAFWVPSDRVRAGIEMSYFDGLKADQPQAVGAQVVGDYFPAGAVELNLGIAKVQAAPYVGVGLGGDWSIATHKWGNTATARGGVEFPIGERIGIGTRYEARWQDVAWEGLTSGNLNHVFLATVTIKF